jgi:hypothetical protein
MSSPPGPLCQHLEVQLFPVDVEPHKRTDLIALFDVTWLTLAGAHESSDNRLEELCATAVRFHGKSIHEVLGRLVTGEVEDELHCPGPGVDAAVLFPNRSGSSTLLSYFPYLL